MKTFIDSLLGGQEAPIFLTNAFFALLGVVLTLLLSTTFRDVESKRTPVAFSWRFFWIDNRKRIAAGIILIYLALRFTEELFGVEVSNFFSVLIGCINDQIAFIVKDKISALRLKLKQQQS